MDDFEELDKKIKDFKANSSTFKLDHSINKKPDNTINLVMDFFITLLVSMAFGYYLDYLLSTKPIFFLISMIFGLISGLIRIYKCTTLK